MLSDISSAHPIIFTIIWQSSLIIAAGLTASYCCRRHSARAHQMLFLSMMAAVIVPFMTITVTHLNIGIFPANLESTAEYVATAEADVRLYRSLPDFAPTVPVESEEPEFPWRGIWFAGWIAVSSILLARLLLSFIFGIQVVNRAQPFKHAKIAEEVKAAALKLGIKDNLTIYSSQYVPSPVIWCWKQRPILLLPSDKRFLNDKTDLVEIFCHELAHLKRRDHVTGLLSELMVVFLPWHLLLWWAKKQLLDLSEHACDDWVITTGGCGVDYAESLLDLVPSKQMAFVPAVVRNKNLLKGRVMRMLTERYGNPRLSKKWILSTILITVCITLTVAFAQTRSAMSDVVDSTPRQDISDGPDNPMGTEREIKEKAKPVIQRFFDACNAYDFEGMRKDFSEILSEAAHKRFEESLKGNLSEYGEIVSWDYYDDWLGDSEDDINFLLRVHVNHAKGDTSLYLFFLDKGQDGNKISGVSIWPLSTDTKQPSTEYMVVYQEHEVDMRPRLISAFSPKYPYLAKRDNLEGIAVVRFVVDTDGQAREPEVVLSYPVDVFDQSALDAIAKYEYEPATKDGAPVSCIVEKPLVFSLN